jgi:hypothetical protein
MAALDNLFWDTRLSGINQARLTPWLYPEHAEFVKGRLALTEATEGEDKAEEIRCAYAAKEAEYLERLETHAKQSAVIAKVRKEERLAREIEKQEEIVQQAEEELEEAEKAVEEVATPKRRGRKPSIKNSPLA